MNARWIEFVVTGPRAEPLAFLRGWLAARGLGEAVRDAEADGIDCEPLRERVKELLQRSSETAHLLVRQDAASTVREALAGNAQLELIGERPVAHARFAFWFTTWSRDEFARLRGLFEKLPPGAALAPNVSFSEQDEKVAEEPRGASGAYAPVHDYEGRGSGAVTGAVDEVLAAWHKVRGEELVKTSAPRLGFGDSGDDSA